MAGCRHWNAWYEGAFQCLVLDVQRSRRQGLPSEGLAGVEIL